MRSGTKSSGPALFVPFTRRPGVRFAPDALEISAEPRGTTSAAGRTDAPLALRRSAAEERDRTIWPKRQRGRELFVSGFCRLLLQCGGLDVPHLRLGGGVCAAPRPTKGALPHTTRTPQVLRLPPVRVVWMASQLIRRLKLKGRKPQLVAQPCDLFWLSAVDLQYVG